MRYALSINLMAVTRCVGTISPGFSDVTIDRIHKPTHILEILRAARTSERALP